MKRRGFLASVGALLAAPVVKLVPAARAGDGVTLTSISHPISPVPYWIEVGGPFEYVIPADMVAKIGAAKLDDALASMRAQRMMRAAMTDQDLIAERYPTPR